MALILLAFRYLWIQFTASGISWLLFHFVMLLFLKGDLDSAYRLLFNSRLAFIFFVYGTACSIGIDGILLFIRREESKRAARWLLFTLSAFLYFGFTIGWNPGTVLAGLIGSLFALVQSAASLGLTRFRKAAYPIAAVEIAALAIMAGRIFS
jgi:hypothetical protein